MQTLVTQLDAGHTANVVSPSDTHTVEPGGTLEPSLVTVGIVVAIDVADPTGAIENERPIGQITAVNNVTGVATVALRHDIIAGTHAARHTVPYARLRHAAK